MTDYLIVYLEILLLTFIYTFRLFLGVRRDMGSDWEIIVFKCVLVTLILALIIDGFTHCQYRGFLHMPPLLVAFLYSSYMFLMSTMLPFLWFSFAELRLGKAIFSNKKHLIISLSPLFVIAFMCYATIWTGWFFTLDENGIYTRGPYWMLQNIVAYFYFILTTVHAILKARKEPSQQQRMQYYRLAMFIIAPFTGAMLQLFIGNHPFVAPATGIAILFIFISIQENMVNHDHLTGLYNRRSIEKRIEDIKAHTSDQNPLYIYILDIDKFKSINDTLGHIEGDRALRIFANVLQKVTDSYHGAAGRLGGDEFIAIIEGRNLNSPSDFSQAFAKAIKQEEQILSLTYSLQSSIGHARCDSAFAETADLITIADKEMYKEKELHR